MPAQVTASRSIKARGNRLELGDVPGDAVAVVRVGPETQVTLEIGKSRAEAFQLKIELRAIAILLGCARNKRENTIRSGQRLHTITLLQKNRSQIAQHAHKDVGRRSRAQHRFQDGLIELDTFCDRLQPLLEIFHTERSTTCVLIQNEGTVAQNALHKEVTRKRAAEQW